MIKAREHLDKARELLREEAEAFNQTPGRVNPKDAKFRTFSKSRRALEFVEAAIKYLDDAWREDSR